jgi:hypothetical protein
LVDLHAPDNLGSLGLELCSVALVRLLLTILETSALVVF